MTQIQDFPRSEYVERLSKLHQAMAEDEIDAVLISDEKNLRYFTGHYTDFYLNRVRKPFAWVPRDKEPILLVGNVDEAWANEVSWCSDVRAFGGLDVGPEEVAGAPELGLYLRVQKLLIETARDIGLDAKSRIGAPMQWGTTLPLRVFLALRSEVGDDDWVDVSSAIWNQRVIKSEHEVEYLREAARAHDRAFARMPEALGVGVVERDAARVFRSALIEEGADVIGFTSVSDLRRDATTPTDRAYTEGAVLLVDAGSDVRGYCTDYNRLVAIGTASDAARSGYSTLVRALQAGIDTVKPGVKMEDIAAAMDKVQVEGGRSDRDFAGRIGHGNGLEMPEPPSVSPGDKTEAQPGMVLCIEPIAEFPGQGLMIVEDMVVVTEDGAELICTEPTPPELIVAE